jgi:hypothetical protein
MAPQDGSVLLFAALAQQEIGHTKLAHELADKALGAGIKPSQIKDHPAFQGRAQ